MSQVEWQSTLLQTDHNRGKKSAPGFQAARNTGSCRETGNILLSCWALLATEVAWPRVRGSCGSRLTADLLSTSHYLEEIIYIYVLRVQFYRRTKIAFTSFKCLWLNCIHTSFKIKTIIPMLLKEHRKWK